MGVPLQPLCQLVCKLPHPGLHRSEVSQQPDLTRSAAVPASSSAVASTVHTSNPSEPLSIIDYQIALTQQPPVSHHHRQHPVSQVSFQFSSEKY